MYVYFAKTTTIYIYIYIYYTILTIVIPSYSNTVQSRERESDIEKFHIYNIYIIYYNTYTHSLPFYLLVNILFEQF